MQRLQQSRRALGSDAIATLVVEDESRADAAFATLWRKVEAFEQRFSRFLPASELNVFNAKAGAKQRVSDEFHALLQTARTMAEQTSGLYNPFILPALQRAGYKGSWPTPDIANAQTNYEARGIAAWQTLEIGNNWARIPEDTALDFGGIGKGYVLDELGGWLGGEGLGNFWLSLGGDILCGGRDADGQPWRVGIQHALQPRVVVGEVSSAEGAMLAIATSGTTKRKGENAHGAWHHLIDPRTGAPAVTSVLTASVCAASAAAADVLAKCLVIVGTSGTEQYMRQLHAENALLQIRERNGAVRVQTLGAIWSE